MKYIQSKTIAEKVKINEQHTAKVQNSIIYARVMQIGINAIEEHEDYKKEHGIVYRWEK